MASMAYGRLANLEHNSMPSRYGRAVSSFFGLLFTLGVGGTAQVPNTPLMVADFEGKHLENVDGLSLVTITDEQLGGTSEARLTLVEPGADRSRAAGKITFKIADGFAMPFAGAYALPGSEGKAADLTSYKGLRFYARAKEGSYLASFGQFVGQAALFMTPFDTKPEWTLVELPFEKFVRVTPNGAPVPNAPAFEPKGVTLIGFAVSSKLRGQFDLEVDQVQLYR